MWVPELGKPWGLRPLVFLELKHFSAGKGRSGGKEGSEHLRVEKNTKGNSQRTPHGNKDPNEGMGKPSGHCSNPDKEKARGTWDNDKEKAINEQGGTNVEDREYHRLRGKNGKQGM